MRIQAAGSVASAKGPAEWFTGNVRVDALIKSEVPAHVGGATVTFEPGARTHWHTHPLGQMLIVVSGAGWAQGEGWGRLALRPGDTVWFAPGEKHWHGATETSGLVHIAVAEALDGKSVEWLEPVTDAVYGADASL